SEGPRRERHGSTRVDPRCHFVLVALRPPVSLDRLRLHLFRPWERACARKTCATMVAPTMRMGCGSALAREGHSRPRSLPRRDDLWERARRQSYPPLEAAVPAHLPQAEPRRGREGLAA